VLEMEVLLNYYLSREIPQRLKNVSPRFVHYNLLYNPNTDRGIGEIDIGKILWVI
jgi:hypothetical protein